jgi:hypothetical protein
MVEIVHLARGKHPTESERFILIEPCSPGGRTTVVHSSDGIVVKVPTPFLRTEIEAFRRMADEAGIPKLYVRDLSEILDALKCPLHYRPAA